MVVLESFTKKMKFEWRSEAGEEESPEDIWGKCLPRGEKEQMQSLSQE